MRSLKHWMRGLLTLPGVVLPLLPSTTCPVCIAAYAGALSTLGLGFLFNARVQTPLSWPFSLSAWPVSPGRREVIGAWDRSSQVLQVPPLW